ncbi:hypothetical protein J3R30DRAFT_1021976 [Lentinula aciculospora]|uniref:JmjC domain-containing protein n=1 Tax=Lentinula aciculospora TaxID=153920 RepID=A0A9W9A3E2_9AGAR|nr:hypothetical protein J3R30DRAFT_1021976 [Lentinula aciculospora]
MFSDPVQNSHSHLQLAERASPRILAQQFVTTNSSSQQSQGETLRKRISPSENASSSQPKKTKKPPTAAPSKRGFTKKKRSETAALQAQNGRLSSIRQCHSYSFVHSSSRPKRDLHIWEKSRNNTREYVDFTIDLSLSLHFLSLDRMRMLQAEDSSAFGAATLIPELQTARCMSSKYKPEDFPRCVSCTRRWAGDTCRFQGIRIFMKNEKKEVVGMGFANNQKAEKPAMDFPKKWNASLTDKDIQWTMRVTAKQVLPILLQERKHVDTQQIIYRPRECDVRATCDTCMTSLFCCSWMCRLCGRESCSDCYEEIVSLTSDPNVDLRDSGLPASPELEAQMASRLAAQHSLKEKQNHSKPFFLTCTKRAEHRAAEFTPVSRFCLRELDEAIRSMEAVLREEEQEESQATDENSETAELNSASSTASDSTGVSTPPDMNVPIQVLHAEKERSYPNANQYLEQQSYYEQPYRPYQHRAQDLHQPEPYVSQLQTAHAHLVSASSSDHQRAQMQYSSQEQYGAGASAHSQSQFSHYAYGRHSDSLPERSSPTQPQIPSPFIRTQLNPYSTTNALTSTPSAPPMLSQNLYQPPSHCSDIPLHAIPTYSFDALTTSVFQKIWKKGTPILVTEVGQRFRIRWTPEYFIKEYGDQSCLIIECQTDTNRRVTVSDFFAEFGKYADRENARDSAEGNPGNQDITPPTSNDEARVGCLCRKGEIWKLKDWPPSADFRTTFPELYEDFSQAVPIPNYVRRDGKLNIASHFPQNALAPDLGPKMYNAMASYQDHGSRGSTRLHMDMADALNVMTYAADCPDGSTGCAAWDLFRAEDSVKLRAYLKMKKLPGSSPMDPIHGQQVYLDEAMRKELAEEWGVYSFRVYQRPGEAVFIPAGCAHQVRNLADCIKVAIDFVSPENVQRCEQLTQEFREQNQSKVWKEDVLQLKTMMWFAWLSCSQQLEERKKIQMEGVLSIRDIHEDSD